MKPSLSQVLACWNELDTTIQMLLNLEATRDLAVTDDPDAETSRNIGVRPASNSEFPDDSIDDPLDGQNQTAPVGRSNCYPCSNRRDSDFHF